jgi:hypothetical protein
MNRESMNDCANCMQFFIIKDGWNSEYCSKKCRDEAIREIMKERIDDIE